MARNGPRSVTVLPHNNRISSDATRLPAICGADRAPGSIRPQRARTDHHVRAAGDGAQQIDSLPRFARLVAVDEQHHVHRTPGRPGRSGTRCRSPACLRPPPRAPALRACCAVASAEPLSHTTRSSITRCPDSACSSSSPPTTAPMLAGFVARRNHRADGQALVHDGRSAARGNGSTAVAGPPAPDQVTAEAPQNQAELPARAPTAAGRTGASRNPAG